MSKTPLKKLLLGIAVVLLFRSLPTHAATESITPAILSTKVGDTFTLSIYVDSSKEAVNAISGTIEFPTDLIRITSVSKANSVVSVWVQEPSFSNTAGSIHYEGIILNPGYTGSNGRVLTVTAKALREGEARMNFTAGSVLANDGKGTNVLSKLFDSIIQISKSSTNTPPSSTTASSNSKIAPEPPQISSVTHPDPSKWYANKDVILNWGVTLDITSVSYAFDQNTSLIPMESTGTITSYKADGVADGIRYFHMRFKNATGWSDTATFPVRIDTTPPSPFSIVFLDGTTTQNPEPRILFGAKDETSGIGKYEVYVGDVKINEIPVPPDSPYYTVTLPASEEGSKTVKVIAYDKAGNTIASEATFTIKISFWSSLKNYIPISIVTTILIVLSAVVLLEIERHRRSNKNNKAKEEPVIQKVITDTPDTSRIFKEKIEEISRDTMAVKAAALKEKLFGYIAQRQAGGAADADIKQELMSVGWEESEINAILEEKAKLDELERVVQDSSRTQ